MFLLSVFHLTPLPSLQNYFLHFLPFHFLPSSTLHFLHYTTLHCTPSPATLHDATLHDTTLHYASLPFSSHHFIPSHFTLIFLLLLLLCIDAVAAMFYSRTQQVVGIIDAVRLVFSKSSTSSRWNESRNISNIKLLRWNTCHI